MHRYHINNTTLHMYIDSTSVITMLNSILCSILDWYLTRIQSSIQLMFWLTPDITTYLYHRMIHNDNNDLLSLCYIQVDRFHLNHQQEVFLSLSLFLSLSYFLYSISAGDTQNISAIVGGVIGSLLIILIIILIAFVVALIVLRKRGRNTVTTSELCMCLCVRCVCVHGCRHTLLPPPQDFQTQYTCTIHA